MDTWIPSCLVLPQRLCPMPTITSLPGVDPFPLRYRRRANATIYAVSPLRTQSSIQTSIGFKAEKSLPPLSQYIQGSFTTR